MIAVAKCVNDAEKQLSLDVYNAVWPHDAVSLDEVRSFEASLLDHVDFLARLDEVVVGSGYAAIAPQRPDRALVLLTVLPRARRRGVGSALYEALSHWSREREIETLEATVADDDPESLAFAHERGFVEHKREPGLVLDLRRIEPPPVEPPPGVEIVTWADRPELARGIYEVAVEADQDIPGSEDRQPEPFEDWLEHDMQGSGDLPEATFVAVAGGDVVGYAKFSLTAAQPKTAHHDLTAVAQAWRNRGIARALKATQIAWAKASGYEQLRTRNEQRNEPIRRLNAELGYEPAVGRVYLRRPVP